MAGADAAFQEDIVGSITPGKLADLAVLTKDIPNGRVELTIPGGEVRYRRSAAMAEAGGVRRVRA